LTPKSVATEIRKRPEGGGLHRGYKLIGLARIIQDAAGTVVIGEPDFSGADAAGREVQKAGAEARLKGRDVLGHRRFGDAHLLGRVCKATLIHHGGEGFHFSEAIHADSSARLVFLSEFVTAKSGRTAALA
jgi:hypothetical protein